MYNYCTLYDKNYLIRGLAMYESLKTYTKKFHLYVFAFDELTEKILKEMNLQNVTVISLPEFEDDELLAVKSSRTKVEYCWTCTPSVIKYCIEKFNLPSCTYIDADLYFYDDPKQLIEEMGDNSVLITPHWYTPIYDQSKTSGIYCVQFLTFKNDPEGMKVLEWWRKACIEWCYARFEDGKFGDQKYLDKWPEMFDKVHILRNKGGGVAPWNVQKYKIIENNNRLYILDLKENQIFPLIFYHFHNLKFLNLYYVYLGNYILDKIVLYKIYFPYINHLLKLHSFLTDKGYKEDFLMKSTLTTNKLLLKFYKINIFNKFFFNLLNDLLPESYWRNGNNNDFMKKLLRTLTAPYNIIEIEEVKRK